MPVPYQTWGYIVAAAMTLAPALPATAGPIADKAAQAEALLDKGDAAGALDLLGEATAIAWQAAPLIIRKALFVEESSGYGIYVERPTPAIYKPGEKIRAYVEPLGFGYGRNAVGGKEIGFDVDFRLIDPDGKELFSRDNFVEVGSPVRYDNREFNLSIAVDLSGLPQGDYIAHFLLRDQNSDKSAGFELPFSVRE